MSYRPTSPPRRRVLTGAAAAGLTWFLPGCRPASTEQAPAGDFATGAIRLDLRHYRAGTREAFDLRRMRIEPRWAGPMKGLTEGVPWGDYRLSVYDPKNEALLFSQGFDSTLDADARSGSTRLAVRFPVPRRGANAAIEKRRAGDIFQHVTNVAFDPDAPAIDRAGVGIETRVETIVANGAPDSKVDVAILGDGYQKTEYAKFLADAKRASGYLFSVEPFKKRLRDFNLYSVFAASPESGVTDPYLGLRRKTVLQCTYGSGQAERTLKADDVDAVYEAASTAPYDFILVIANARRYGGSAHFGGPAVVAIDSAAARYLVLHEFAHVIGGLAEEYYIPTSHGPAYAGNVEPWNPNVTISPEKAKWGDVSLEAAPRTTTWNKAEYERYFAGYVKRYFALRDKRAFEAAVEKFMEEESRVQAALLAKNGNRRTGFVEGANGYARGVFRSEANCIMFSLQTDYFCAACSAAIERMIDQHCA